MITLLSVLLIASSITSCDNRKAAPAEKAVVVGTITAGTASAQSSQSYPGTIEELNGTSLSFATGGTIKQLRVSEGQWVRAGEVIGIVDPTTSGNTVAMAKASTRQALETQKQAEDAYRRMKILHDRGSLPEIKWVEVETKLSQARQMVHQARASEKIARKGLSDTRLVAPFSGYISSKDAEVGQNVMPGVPVAKLVKIDQVKVKISVPEGEMSKIKTGQAVSFTVPSLGNVAFTGRIVEKGISADPMSRQYEVRVLVNNSQHKLLPGMVCDASLNATTTSSHILLPANVVQIDIDNHPFVWTVKGDKAKKTYITLGPNIGSNIIITRGLQTGQKVIAEGYQKVSNGMTVKTI